MCREKEEEEEEVRGGEGRGTERKSVCDMAQVQDKNTGGDHGLFFCPSFALFRSFVPHGEVAHMISLYFFS